MKAKEIIARIVIGGLLMVVLLTLAAPLLLRVPAVQRYLLARIEQAAGAALQTEVHIHRLDVRLSELTADLRGLTIRGNATNHAEPLLYVPHMKLNFKILSVVRLQWNLNSIMIDHPVVHVFAGESGETNVPTQQKSERLPDSVFDLAVQHAVIDGGEIYYENTNSSISADVHDLQFQARHDNAAGGRYLGKLAYRRGSLRFGLFDPIPHN